jgi:hypothetical protein
MVRIHLNENLKSYICGFLLFSPPPLYANTRPYRRRGFPSGCGRSVTDFWGWGAHRARLLCPYDVWWYTYERGVPGGALNLNSTSYPDHGLYGDVPLQGKIPTAEPGIEAGASR